MVFYRLEIIGYGMFKARAYGISQLAREMISDIGLHINPPNFKLLSSLSYNTKSWFTEEGWKYFEENIQELITELKETETEFEIIIKNDLDPMKLHSVDNFQVIENIGKAVEKELVYI